MENHYKDMNLQENINCYTNLKLLVHHLVRLKYFEYFQLHRTIMICFQK